jgi:hypothetical protein
MKAPQEIHRLKSGGYGPGCSAHPHRWVRGTPWSVRVAGREAVVNVCGVATAMLQGHSWVPIPSNGRKVNVGTIPVVPNPGNMLTRCGMRSQKSWYRWVYACRWPRPGSATWTMGLISSAGTSSAATGEVKTANKRFTPIRRRRPSRPKSTR